MKKIAQQSETGPATTILGGISTGMVSVFASVALGHAMCQRQQRADALRQAAGITLDAARLALLLQPGDVAHQARVPVDQARAVEAEAAQPGVV